MTLYEKFNFSSDWKIRVHLRSLDKLSSIYIYRFLNKRLLKK